MKVGIDVSTLAEYTCGTKPSASSVALAFALASAIALVSLVFLAYRVHCYVAGYLFSLPAHVTVRLLHHMLATFALVPSNYLSDLMGVDKTTSTVTKVVKNHRLNPALGNQPLTRTTSAAATVVEEGSSTGPLLQPVPTVSIPLFSTEVMDSLAAVANATAAAGAAAAGAAAAG